MEKFYQPLRWLNVLITTTLLLTIYHNKSFAQPGPPLQEGVVRIKVTEALAAQLEGRKFSRTLTGEVLTGISTLDNMNRQFKVKRFTRLFRHAGKNEARHRKYGLHLWYEVSMDKGSPVSQAVESYRSDKQIIKAEPVYEKALIGSANKNFGPVIHDKIADSDNIILPAGSNDPMLGSQWHYNNTGQTGGTPGADIKLLDAWQLETGKKEVVVALTDGGIQTNHEDLAANVWVNTGEIPGNNIDDDNNGFIDDIHGYSFVDNKGNITPHFHGTHVAGTIAAVSNNGIGVAGIAGGSGTGDGVRLMSCAVFNDGASDGLAESYIYAADNGAIISQNSWGYVSPDIYEEAVIDAIDYFIAEAGMDENGNQVGMMKGGIVIFSAGNNNSEGNYFPAFYPPAFAVASTTHKDLKAWYSNFGSWVDISAPGGETDQAGQQGVMSTLNNNKYGYLMGTSMACPHVSGLAALIISNFGKSGFTSEMLKQRLKQTANNIDSKNPEYSGKMGAGRINAFAALQKNDNIPPATITDLAVSGVAVGEVTLTWKTPLDEGSFVAGYDLRYTTSPITAENFNKANAANGLPFPKSAGSTETFTVSGLAGGTRFYFAVKSKDFEGNVSAISNVVSQMAALTPVITLSPASLTVGLKTAQTTTRTFTISNTGQGPLEFTLDAEKENAFASYTPQQGTAAPGTSQTITVSFDANNLFSGTYRQSISIHTNDPERQTVLYPLTLNVTNNNAPIVSAEPDSIHFKSVQTGSLLNKTVTLHNAGSNPLTVSQAVSNNSNFITDFSASLTVPPFENKTLTITFKPQTLGMSTGQIAIHSDDPVNSVLKIYVSGEGLNVPPIVITPDPISMDVPRGTTASQPLTLRNNGSFERKISLNVINNGPASGTEASEVPAMASDSGRKKFLERREQIIAMLKANPAALDPMFRAIPVNNAFDESNSYPNPDFRYITDFEEFNIGMLDTQHNWSAGPGWLIQNTNAFSGQQHVQGKSNGFGMDSYAFAPSLKFDIYEEGSPHRFTYASMKINLDNSKGVTWDLVPQEPEPAVFFVTRVRFTADGKIMALSVDEAYEYHWLPIPVDIPPGYFDFAIELDSYGDEESGFPKFTIHINNHQVFTGRALGLGIGQVILYSANETEGSSILVDDLTNAADEFIPNWLNLSKTSFTIPAGAATSVEMNVDATTMRHGVYSSDLQVTVDEVEELTIPATLTVSGPQTGGQCTGTGNIQREVWTNISGKLVSSIPVNSPPASVSDLTIFESPANVGDNYGSRIRGYICVPQSGSYTFWIASDDHSELWLSSDENAANKILIASVSAWTRSREWTKYASQQSAAISLQAGQKYYIEALHKENYGGDNLAVGWRLPDGTQERPIPGTRLVPFQASENNDPVVSITSPEEGQSFTAPASVNISATASDSDGNVTKVEFYNGTTKLGEDATAPYAYTWNNVSAGNYTLMAKAIDNDGASNTASVDIVVTGGQACAGAEKIEREVWNGITGMSVSLIPVNSTPSSISELMIFESPVNVGDNYGSRIRGYICVPATGGYTFWIASDDHSELWLSSDENAANKIKIASVSEWTRSREWTKYASQQSAVISLQAGQKYYIEALHKENYGGDNLAVGWQLPDGIMERPIPGHRLSPVVRLSASLANQPDHIKEESGMHISLYPNPASKGTIKLVIEGYAGNERTSNEARLEIRNMTGMPVYSNILSCNDNCVTEIEINENFTSGVYMIQVKFDNKTFSKKLVVR